MDLRTSELEEQDLAAALRNGAELWTAGSSVDVEVDVSATQGTVPKELEKDLLRIAQEAVANVLKHAGASKVWLRAKIEARKLYIQVVDNGRGFEQGDAFSSSKG